MKMLCFVAILLLGISAANCGSGQSLEKALVREQSVRTGQRQVQQQYELLRDRFTLLEQSKPAVPTLGLTRLLKLAGGLPQGQAPDPVFVKLGDFHGAIWMAIGIKKICIAQPSRAGVYCEPPAQVRKWGIALGTFQESQKASVPIDDFVVVGIAPDGKQRVDFDIGRTRVTKETRRNLYGVRATVPIRVQALRK
jgi:hypothetical protein